MYLIHPLIILFKFAYKIKLQVNNKTELSIFKYDKK